MPDPSEKAKWDALAEMLGAKVNPIEPPAAPPRPPASSPPRIQIDVPPAARKRPDWDALAGELGVEAPRRPEPPIKPSPSELPTSTPHESKPAAEASAGQREPIPAEKSRERGEPSRSAERPRRESRAPRKEQDQERQESLELEGPLEEMADEQASPTVSRRGIKDDAEYEPDSERRPRRRRRRGRRREEPADEEVDREEIGAETDEQRPLDKPARRERPDRRDDDDDDGSQRAAGHKGIPSWAEAISIIIDGNMAGRSTRRRAGPGRTRGRRGGRRG